MTPSEAWQRWRSDPLDERWPAVADALLRRGQQAHPDFTVEPAAFFKQLLETNTQLPSDAGAWTELHAEDLYLAAGCERGERRAIQRLEAERLPAVRPTLLRVSGSEAGADEARQRMRELLLMPGASRRPRMAEYGGRGPLERWLRAIATRVAVDQRTSSTAAVSDQQVLDAVIDGGDGPELARLKSSARQAFHAAFRAAFASLTERERAVLQMHYADGITTERLGQLYGVHRISITRWLVAARQSLLERTRERLREELAIDAAEVDSLIRAVRSQLGRSLSGLRQRPTP